MLIRHPRVIDPTVVRWANVGRRWLGQIIRKRWDDNIAVQSQQTVQEGHLLYGLQSYWNALAVSCACAHQCNHLIGPAVLFAPQLMIKVVGTPVWRAYIVGGSTLSAQDNVCRFRQVSDPEGFGCSVLDPG